ncbi:SAM-dependent methyltransferase [Nocardia colli]|uniref:SAM-dependent methyltransferase n=1 Tax=Nocardia colli TaxID=2545717 RepID=UPI0035D8D740
MANPEVPEGIDLGRPSIARAYDAVLGGKDNYDVDQEVADRLRETMPQIGELAWYNRAILGRGVRYLTGEAGIRQFLDLGAGLPTMENTHQVAQSVDPQARVVYVDIDPIVLAHGRALLATNGLTDVETADLRDSAAVLGAPRVRKLIDFTEPVAVMLVGMLHHLHDDEDPKGIVDAYMSAVPSGSYLFLTHFCDSGPEARELEKTFLTFLGTGRFRTHDEVAALFAGLEMVDPGLVYLPQWRPDRIVRDKLTIAERLMIGAIARKP